MSKKALIVTLLAIVIATLPTIYFCNRSISHSAKPHLYADTKTIPFNRVGLLLGTSKTIRGGRENPYYTNRIEAAVRLLRDKKIKYLIISGDNGRKEYNEPETMRADIIRAGVDSSIIYLDYAGFRTLDSVRRLKEVFGQDSVTFISQQFHNERAIYIVSKEGITAIGYNAADVNVRQGIKTQARELLARVKVFLDVLFGTEAKFLGNSIRIPN